MGRPYRKKLNPHLVEKHRCYSVEDLSELFQTHKQSIFKWFGHGLKKIDGHMPFLVFGEDLIGWIKLHRPVKKPACDSTRVYCVKCRDHVIFDVNISWKSTGNKGGHFLKSRCPICNCTVNKISKKSESETRETEKGLTGSSSPAVNTNKKKENHDVPIQRKKRAYQIPLF